MKSIKESIVLFMMTLVLLTGCGNNNDQEFRNIEQIQQSSGIPVRVDEISPRHFTISLDYNANLSGVKETVLSSLVADRIEKIHVKVGDYVEKDDLLISFPEDNPSAQFKQAKAAYENTLQTYQRMIALFEQGGISQQELDQLQTAKIVHEANFKASEKMIKVRAPYNGYVTDLSFRETDTVGPGDPLLTIAQINKYQAKIWVTESDILSFKPGLEGVARWQNHSLPGKVTQVARSIERGRQAFSVDLEFNNPNDLLLSGVMASIEVFSYENRDAIVIERQFILSDREGSFVYLAEDNRAIKRYIALGENDGILYEVTAGLAVGDPLIKQGANQVDANSLIRIVD